MVLICLLELYMVYNLYIFAGACIITASVYIYIYLSNPFWCRQPVVHTYDLWRRWGSYTPTILYDSKTPPTKYYFPEKAMSFCPINEPEKLKQCVRLLQNHYIAADNVLFSIQEAYLLAHCIGYGSDIPPMVTVYFEQPSTSNITDVIESENQQPSVLSPRTPQAMIAAFPSTVYFPNFPPLPVYFWNFICVHREYKDRMLIRPLIQTHEYKQRSFCAASVFRCDIDLQSGVVPLTRGFSHTFHIHRILAPSPTTFHIIRIESKSIDTMSIFIEFMQRMAKLPSYRLYMTPSLENVIELMNAGILYIYAGIFNNSIVALYFFKNVCTTYEDLDDDSTELDDTVEIPTGHTTGKGIPTGKGMPTGKGTTFPGSRTIHCIGCINSVGTYEFGIGFIAAVNRLIKSSNYQFNVLVLDEMEDPVLAMCMKWFALIMKTEYAYYAYNWLVPGMPLSPKECLILG